MIYTRYRGLTSDPAVFEQSITELRSKLDGYEAILSKQKYLAGDVRRSLLQLHFSPTPPDSQEVTLADLFHLPFASLLPVAGSGIMDEKPHVARYVPTTTRRRLIGKLIYSQMVQGHQFTSFLDCGQGWH